LNGPAVDYFQPCGLQRPRTLKSRSPLISGDPFMLLVEILLKLFVYALVITLLWLVAISDDD
jgi:hypothetical protein